MKSYALHYTCSLKKNHAGNYKKLLHSLLHKLNMMGCTAKSVFIFTTIVLALATANHFEFGTLVHSVDLVLTTSILAP